MGTKRLGDLLDTTTNEIRLVDWQMDFISHPARHKVAVCGRRSGKTTMAASLVYGTAIDKPGAEIWVVALTYKQAKKLYFRELLKLFPPKAIVEVNKTELYIELWNGSSITLKGANNPDSLLGSGLDLLILDEYQSQNPELLDYLTPMLADREGELVLIGTPRGYNHLYEAYQRGQKESEWHSVKVTTLTAGVIPATEIENARNRMDPKMFEQEFNASFENMQGRVYYDFDLEASVRPVKDNPRAALWIGLDFNIGNMNAVVCQVADHHGQRHLHVIDEIHLNTNDADVPKMIKEILHRYPNRNIIICPDASGRNRDAASANPDSTKIALLKKHGFVVKYEATGNPYIEDRVAMLNGLILNTNGVRKFYVAPHCKQTIKTLNQRVYENGAPVKDGKVDHMADALEYVVWQIFKNTNQVFVEKF